MGVRRVSPEGGRAAEPVPKPGNQFARQQVAKTSPLEFMRQVQAETKKVVWPTRKETVMTAVMVFIMASLLGIFFFGVDRMFGAIVNYLLGLAA
jgi:preprotein translocase subunit SecE